MAVVADAEIDSPAGVVPGAPERVHPQRAHYGIHGMHAVRPVGTVVNRPVRMRPVRLVRAGDRRRPGHVITVPARRVPSVACVPRSTGASLGWLILTAGLVTLAVFGIGWLTSSGSTSSVPVPSATTVVTIHSGETLWGVATDEAPSSAPQDVVDRILQLNDISDATLYPGERLVVPVDTAAASH
jgi:hypothetical protein